MARRRDFLTLDLNQREIKKLAGRKETKAAIEENTIEVANTAKEIAPVRTGAYRAGITPVVEKRKGRWEGRVEGRDPKSSMIEFGTKKTPPRAVLRRALEQVFGRLDATERSDRGRR